MRLEMHLLLPAEAKLLARTRHTVAGFLEDVGTARDDVDDVVLALDEACANAIRHGAGSDPAVVYTLHAEVTPDRVVIEVSDDGPGCRLQDVVPAAVPATAVSGRGLRLINELMDEFSVGPGDDGRGTVVRMARDLA